MSNISYNIRRISLLFLFVLLTGCAKKEEPQLPLRDSTPVVLEPLATGELIFESPVISLDASSVSNGYLVLTYLGSNEKVKFQIGAPDGVTYTYLVSRYNEPMVLPLTGGDGDYLFTLYESVDAQNDKYAIAFSQDASVTISNEFLPYLTPNVYASFDKESACVSKGEELAKDCYKDLDVINNIYHEVTGSISYDKEKALSVAYGYIPDPDKTLEEGKGICFDYASLMTSMLRSQRIPTRLEVGYVGTVYHAWISCYVAEIGWVDNIIQFDGEHWSLMDPTLAASNNSSSVRDFIGDGSNYLVKYTY